MQVLGLGGIQVGGQALYRFLSRVWIEVIHRGGRTVRILAKEEILVGKNRDVLVHSMWCDAGPGGLSLFGDRLQEHLGKTNQSLL